MSQRWPLSQKANKDNGVCSHCSAVCQLHLKDSTIHAHGPRASRCPGSNKPPMGARVPTGNLQGLGGFTLNATANSSVPVGNAAPALSGDPTTIDTSVGPLLVNTSVDHTRTISVGSSIAAGQNAHQSDISATHGSLSHPVLIGPIMRHIPKSARPACCSALSKILSDIAANRGDVLRWAKLFQFCPSVLSIPARNGDKPGLSELIKRRAVVSSSLDDPPLAQGQLKRREFDLAKAVSTKIEDGNIKAAFRLLSSDDKPSSCSAAALAAMHARHPEAPSDRASAPDISSFSSFEVLEVDILKAIKSFPAGSAGGPDGLKPQHLLELVSCQSSGQSLLTAITGFVNIVLSGGCPLAVRPIFFGAKLISLEKKLGGFRPIAIGYTLRRLVAKCANLYALRKLAGYFRPVQLGVAISGGCEAAIHASRRFVEEMADDEVLVKLDFSNAFNSIRRDAVLNAVAAKLPELYAFCNSAYSGHSFLVFDKNVISSQEGVQQGDPLGPLLFCLVIHPLLCSLSAKLKIGYLDDITLGGSTGSVNGDVASILSAGSKLGLQLNKAKCEVISRSAIPTGLLLSQFSHLSPVEATLLGAPLIDGVALDEALLDSRAKFVDVADRLSRVSAHDALVLLKSCGSTPRILHLLRSSPCSRHPTLSLIDEVLRRAISRITNTRISDVQWAQVVLPVKSGGLGIRSASHLAPSAYLAAFSASSQLQAQILSLPSVAQSRFEASALAAWLELSSAQCQPDPLPPKQKEWDKAVIAAEVNRLFSLHPDHARLLAVSAPHSSDWLSALPISNCGLRLSDEEVRVAVGLRLGANLCLPHPCQCGVEVDSVGSHALSCKKSSARIQRHNALNDVLFRALLRAGVPAMKEPPGLLRSDGKRPDGVTQIPWVSGKCLAWDVTVTDTLARSYAHLSSISAGKAAERAAEGKMQKYAAMSATHDFQPIAIETLGPINSSAIHFLHSLGKRIATASGDPRETTFLFQRLSITLQRFNSVAFRETFPAGFIDADDP